MPQILKCPSCAAPLQYDGRSPSVRCDYCNNVTLMPKEFRQEGASDQNSGFGSGSSYGSIDQSLSAGKLVEIKNLMARGQKIQAIKLFRETFNVGLKEAKEAVERLEQGDAVNLTEMTFESSPSIGELNQSLPIDKLVEINEQLQQGQKIQAINLFRETFNVGLKEAKDAVEQLERGEAINLSGGQSIMAFQDIVARNQMAGGADSRSNVPRSVVLGGAREARNISGFVAGFFGQFGCLLFLFFWIPFLLVMVGSLIYPDMVLYAAPFACDEGYEEAYSERVGYYSTSNFEGNNIVLLHCVYGEGVDEIPHPLKVDGYLFAIPMAILAVLAFGIAFMGQVRSMAGN